MAETTGIQWCDSTFNPVVGCERVSPGCQNCYASDWAKRTGHPELWDGSRRRTSVANWREPIKWNAKAKEFQAKHGRRQRVFCASLADVFDNQWDKQWRADLWALIDACQELEFLLLTKRPQNIPKMLPEPDAGYSKPWGDGWLNVWLGTTTKNQEEACRRLPHLLSVKAAKHFVSAEPLLGPVDFRSLLHREDGNLFHLNALTGEDWLPGAGSISSQTFKTGKLSLVIVGGESGPKARPMAFAWVRDIRDQCKGAGTAFFMKQTGGKRKPFAPIPDDLMVREMPT